MMVDNHFEKVDLFLSGSNLPKLHTFNVTDPFAIIYVVDKRDNSLTQIGMTETVQDSLNPAFTKNTTVDYLFEEIQDIFIHIYHYATPKPELIGEVRFQLSALMCSAAQTITVPIVNGERAGLNLGTIQIHGEAQSNTRDMLAVTFSGNKLSNKDGFFGRSDPFLEIARLNEDGSWTPVWRSQRIDNTLNPRWTPVKIPMVTLCNGDIDRPLRISVWDWEKSGKHQPMGDVDCTVRSLLEAKGAAMSVIEADKRGTKKYVHSGTLQAADIVIEHHPTFGDFVMGGCEISLVVGIDFTGSNGDPREVTSLHYLDPSQRSRNVYQQAITVVGNVLEPYDSDHLYSVFGYGARIRLPGGSFTPVQHCFPVYGGGNQVAGVAGILQAYQDCLHHVMLSGPTLLAPIISATAQIAASDGCTQPRQKYYILLIITDGVINDMEQTKAAVVAASRLPLSIVIIGVGPADFKDMETLDSDRQLLQANKAVAERDIVQFVAFKPGMGAQSLAQQVLAEIPQQLLDYMEKRNITPNPRRS